MAESVPGGPPRPASRRVPTSVLLFVLVPAVLTACLIVYLLAQNQFAFDFRREYWVVGSRVLHGHSPYVWSRQQIYEETAFAYPAGAALLFVPFALLPVWAGAVLFTLVCVACVAGTLRALAVTDWRLYGLGLMWGPVVAGWQSANLTLPMVLALALAWRYRDRPLLSGAIAAAMISLKPFLWPVLLWLLATRRYRAAGWTIGGAAAGSTVAWALIGDGHLISYLRLAGRVTDMLYRNSYGVMALASHVGASRMTAEAVLIVLSTVIALACARVGARSDLNTLTLCVVLALVASPLVDTHYLALLIVPLALARPRLSIEWCIPLVLWLCPESSDATWQVVLMWVVITLTAWLTTRPQVTITPPRLRAGF